MFVENGCSHGGGKNGLKEIDERGLRGGGVLSGLDGEKIAESFYINIIDYVQHDVYNFAMIVMIILAGFNLLGVINGIYGLVCKNLKHASINLALFTGFASGIAGALHLYSKSYVFFIICAASFIMITLCSFKLNKSEVYNYKQ